MLYVPSLSFFKYDVTVGVRGGVPPESEKPCNHPSIACGKVFVVGKVFAWERKNLIKI